LVLTSRQRIRRLDLRLLQRIAQALLDQLWPVGGLDVAIHVVGAPEITRLNEAFLRHKGSTDVITFDYSERAGQASRLPAPKSTDSGGLDRQDACPTLLHGEIFVCLDEAFSQSQRFRATWQSELVRYLVHGALHLLGYDDQKPAARRKMKKAEDAHVRALGREFHFRRLAR
jgi:probable rRNA maturation factor